MLSTHSLNELIFEVFRTNGLLLAAGDLLIADIGLTSARWQVLGAACKAPGPRPVAHLAREIGVSRQAVQRIVNELLDSGLVTLADNPHHRRAKLVVPTERGLAIHAAADERQAPWAAAIASAIPSSGLDEARDTLRLLRQAIQNKMPSLESGNGSAREGTIPD